MAQLLTIWWHVWIWLHSHLSARLLCWTIPGVTTSSALSESTNTMSQSKIFYATLCNAIRPCMPLRKAELAFDELIKVIDLVNSAYITDRYEALIKSMYARRPTMADCKYNLNAIFEIYTDVICLPRRQITSDNKYLPPQSVINSDSIGVAL